MQVISWLLNLALGAIAVYLFFDNRRLRQLDADKTLKLLDIQEDEIKLKYKRLKGESKVEMARRGISSSSTADGEIKKLEDDETRELAKLQIEREHLLKIASRRRRKN
ncbi:MAG: hypothetical protein WC891_02175 [Actinomycetota bacterium]